ncbi:hypothetical protein DICVIV_03016 [Dictyocaulus viviparus]|uniref:E3 ubiquitin-protein ligase HECW1/2 N-terminal domain-containing protein n=1 Tax=Dictyocaulus viviparus TaxID=29172 RepID=A0A0D8Y8G5_DICVI|nr:hypothetical protein DICVIV_03016 [Dictyocaulus viviparus]
MSEFKQYAIASFERERVKVQQISERWTSSFGPTEQFHEIIIDSIDLDKSFHGCFVTHRVLIDNDVPAQKNRLMKVIIKITNIGCIGIIMEEKLRISYDLLRVIRVTRNTVVLRWYMIVIRRNNTPTVMIPPICDNRLGVSTDLLYIGENLSQVIFVKWKLSHETNMIDWIGLFDSDDDNPLHYHDHKGRGVVGPREGTVAWNVARASLPSTVKNIHFGYVDGLTGVILARSPPIRITDKAQLVVQGEEEKGVL